MSATTAVMLSLSKVVVLGTVLIGGIYGFVIPTFFPDYRTYLILIFGTGASALIGGLIGYHFPIADTLLAKICLGFCSAILIAILVAFLSLLVIVNVRGS